MGAACSGRPSDTAARCVSRVIHTMQRARDNQLKHQLTVHIARGCVYSARNAVVIDGYSVADGTYYDIPRVPSLVAARGVLDRAESLLTAGQEMLSASCVSEWRAR